MRLWVVRLCRKKTKSTFWITLLYQRCNESLLEMMKNVTEAHTETYANFCKIPSIYTFLHILRRHLECLFMAYFYPIFIMLSTINKSVDLSRDAQYISTMLYKPILAPF